MLSYYKQIIDGGYTYSIDNVRLSLRGDTEDVNSFLAFVSEFEMQFEPKDYKYFQSFKIFTYRHMFTFGMGESSATIGIDFIDCKRHDSIIGFAEFNPNKVGSDIRFKTLLSRIRDNFKEVIVSRWDMAIDIPVSRDYVRLEPDMRNYETHKSHSGFTEYLGIRNKHGRVKLYDKTRESNLDYDLTRLELTIDGHCEYSDLPIPRILGISSQLDIDTQMNLNDTELVLYRLLLGCSDMVGEFKNLGRKMQAKLKPYLFREDKAFQVSRVAYSQLLQQLRDYEIRLFK